MTKKSLLLVVLLVSCSPATVVVGSSNPSAPGKQGSGSHGGSGAKTYECKSANGCTVRVNGQHYGYGQYAPYACGADIIVLGCGCGYDVPASCSCGETYQPSPSCGPASCGSATPPPSCSAPSCGSASCGSCSTSSPPPPDRDH